MQTLSFCSFLYWERLTDGEPEEDAAGQKSPSLRGSGTENSSHGENGTGTQDYHSATESVSRWAWVEKNMNTENGLLSPATRAPIPAMPGVMLTINSCQTVPMCFMPLLSGINSMADETTPVS